jgi:hypothetical protein
MPLNPQRSKKPRVGDEPSAPSLAGASFGVCFEFAFFPSSLVLMFSKSIEDSASEEEDGGKCAKLLLLWAERARSQTLIEYQLNDRSIL